MGIFNFLIIGSFHETGAHVKRPRKMMSPNTNFPDSK